MPLRSLILCAVVALSGCASVGQLQAAREGATVDVSGTVAAWPVAEFGVLIEGGQATVCVAAPGQAPVCEAVPVE